MIVLSASDISLAISDPFGLWQDHHGDPKLKDPEDEYDLFLAEQGLRIEKELLIKRHAAFTDLKNVAFDEAVGQTTALLQRGNGVIYGGALQSERLGLRARPDVIKIDRGACLIEEYKLAGTPDETHKIQALVYAYLLKNGYGIENECRVVSRLNEEFPIPYDEPRVEDAVRYAREILVRDQPPYPTYNCPSVWGSLQNKTARDLRDITLAWNVGPVLAGKLHQINIHTLEDLAKLEPGSLKTIKGLGPKKIPQIVNSVKAQLSNHVIKVGPWTETENSPEIEIFLDLEGSGELFQDDPAWNCIYLIGLIPRSTGREESYIPYLAKRPEDEKTILSEFVDHLRKQHRRYRLYHWHHYEKTQLKKACERHGLSEAYDSLILPHLEDLCIAAQASYVLPTPGWSIKVVAPYFGFRWTQDASEVDAMKSAMIWFKQALNGGDGNGLEKVLRYNQDDCRAMIVVKDGFDDLERAHRGASPARSRFTDTG
jgi:predicted RecB family nuclease